MASANLRMKDGEFNDYLQPIPGYLTTNKVRLGVSDPNLATLNGQFASWNTTYPLSQNKDTRTSAITKTKNLLKKQTSGTLRKIYADIPESALNVDDRAILRIIFRDTNPSPAPVPTTIPGISLHGGDGSQVIIRYIILGGEPGSRSNRKKPEHVKYMEFCYKIGDPAPVNPEQCNLRVIISKIPYYLNLDSALSGKPLRGFGRWVNTRNQPGPWSAMVSINIP